MLLLLFTYIYVFYILLQRTDPTETYIYVCVCEWIKMYYLLQTNVFAENSQNSDFFVPYLSQYLCDMFVCLFLQSHQFKQYAAVVYQKFVYLPTWDDHNLKNFMKIWQLTDIKFMVKSHCWLSPFCGIIFVCMFVSLVEHVAAISNLSL